MKKFLMFIVIVLIIVSGIQVGIEYAQDKNNIKINENKQNKENKNSSGNKVNLNNFISKEEKDVSQENIVENNVENIVEENIVDEEVNVEEKSELFSRYYEKADELMEDMTLEEKVGQMFLARYPEEGVIDEIKNHNPGGYILFGRDFDNETPKTILKELQSNQSASKINLILGVDEEGGTVVRVSNHKAFRDTRFLSPQQLWNKGGLEAILKDSTFVIR